MSGRFPKETPLIADSNRTAIGRTNFGSTLPAIKRYPEMIVTVNTNENLVKFFDTYPRQ